MTEEQIFWLVGIGGCLGIICVTIILGILLSKYSLKEIVAAVKEFVSMGCAKRRKNAASKSKT